MAVDPSDITASSLGLYGTDASEAVRTSVVARVRAALAGTGQNGGSFDPSGLDTVAAAAEVLAVAAEALGAAGANRCRCRASGPVEDRRILPGTRCFPRGLREIR